MHNTLLEFAESFGNVRYWTGWADPMARLASILRACPMLQAGDALEWSEAVGYIKGYSDVCYIVNDINSRDGDNRSIPYRAIASEIGAFARQGRRCLFDDDRMSVLIGETIDRLDRIKADHDL